MKARYGVWLAVLFATGFGAAPAVFAAGVCTPRSVGVTGRGEVSTAVGVYVFHIGIAYRNTDIRAANAAVDKASVRAVNAARRAGLVKADIRSTHVTISPVYDAKAKAGEAPRYEVTRTITLALHRPANYGKLVEGLIGAGVNRIADIEARPADPQALADRALAAAVADARHKAQRIAVGLGVHIGPALEVNEQSYPGLRPVMMNATRSGNAGGYEPGRLTVTAIISARFALSPSGCPHT